MEVDRAGGPAPGSGESVRADLSAWEKARDEFLRDPTITAEEDKFLRKSSAKEAVDHIRAWESKKSEQSKIRVALRRLRPLVNGLESYGRAFDVLAQTAPMGILSFIWGGVRLILVTVKDSADAFADICSHLGHIGDAFQAISTLARLLPTSPRLNETILDAFKSFLAFNRLVFSLIHRTSRPVRSGFLQILGNQKVNKIKRGVDDVLYYCSVVEKESNLIVNETLLRSSKRIQTALDGQNQELQLIRDVASPRKTTQTSVDNLMNQQKFWEWLCPIDPREDFMRILNDSKRQLCEWVQRSPEYIKWESFNVGLASKSGPRILWVNARAGAGKTYAVARIIELIQKSTEVAYFFCNNNDPLYRAEDMIYRALLAQLLRKFPTEIDLVEYLSQQQALLRIDTLRKVLLSIVERHSCCLVVDGIDECEKEIRGNILSFMTEAVRYGAIIIAGRPELDIEDRFRALGGLVSSFTIRREDTISDIDAYLHSHLEDIAADLALSGDFKLRIFDTLRQEADGMFLWVRLMIDEIKEQVTLENLEMVLQGLPSGLDALYSRIIARIRAYKPQKRSLTYKMLRWIVYALRPLAVGELKDALSIPGDREGGDTLLKPKQTIIECCGSLVEIDERTDIVRLVHSSVVDFFAVASFEDPDLSNLSISPGLMHGQLARSCLIHLSLDIHQPSFNMRDFNPRQGELRRRLEQSPLLLYAAHAWWLHLGRASRVEMILSPLVHFISSEEKSIHWLQILHQTTDSVLESNQSLNGQLARRNFRMGRIIYELRETFEKISLGVETVKQTNLRRWIDRLGGPISHYGTLARWYNYSNSNSKTFLHPANLAAMFDYGQLMDNFISGTSTSKAHRSDIQDWLNRAIFIAAENSSLSCIRVLIRRGANPNHKNENGNSVLVYSIKTKASSAILSILLEAGANVSEPAYLERYPLHLAQKTSEDQAYNVELVKTILEYEPNLEARDRFGYTPLAYSVVNDLKEVFLMLSSQGADINSTIHESGSSILHLACKYSHEIACHLLDTGVCVNKIDKNGSLPLHVAAEEANISLVQKLVDAGNPLNESNRKGLMAMDIAQRNGYVASSATPVECYGSRFAQSPRTSQARPTVLYYPRSESDILKVRDYLNLKLRGKIGHTRISDIMDRAQYWRRFSAAADKHWAVDNVIAGSAVPYLRSSPVPQSSCYSLKNIVIRVEGYDQKHNSYKGSSSGLLALHGGVGNFSLELHRPSGSQTVKEKRLDLSRLLGPQAGIRWHQSTRTFNLLERIGTNDLGVGDSAWLINMSPGDRLAIVPIVKTWYWVNHVVNCRIDMYYSFGPGSLLEKLSS